MYPTSTTPAMASATPSKSGTLIRRRGVGASSDERIAVSGRIAAGITRSTAMPQRMQNFHCGSSGAEQFAHQVTYGRVATAIGEGTRRSVGP